MRYHNISKDDMLNGDGLRVVLWTSGCIHHCKGCHNPITWNANDGLVFDENAKNEIFEQLNMNYISGITFSGGDPLHENNILDILNLTKEIKEKYPNKTIWSYSGYKISEIFEMSDDLIQKLKDGEKIDLLSLKIIPGMEERASLIKLLNVFVDGRFEEDKKSLNYHWAGSTNQLVLKIEENYISLK